jgi:hypothetical protein
MPVSQGQTWLHTGAFSGQGESVMYKGGQPRRWQGVGKEAKSVPCQKAGTMDHRTRPLWALCFAGLGGCRKCISSQYHAQSSPVRTVTSRGCSGSPTSPGNLASGISFRAHSHTIHGPAPLSHQEVVELVATARGGREGTRTPRRTVTGSRSLGHG